MNTSSNSSQCSGKYAVFSVMTGPCGSTSATTTQEVPEGIQGKNGQRANRTFTAKTIPKKGCGLKPKDLVGIPWRVAFALQADGWYLRSDIIWHKPNPMPESVIDRHAATSSSSF